MIAPPRLSVSRAVPGAFTIAVPDALREYVRPGTTTADPAGVSLCPLVDTDAVGKDDKVMGVATAPATALAETDVKNAGGCNKISYTGLPATCARATRSDSSWVVRTLSFAIVDVVLVVRNTAIRIRL